MHIGLGLPKIPQWSAMLTGEELGCGEEEEALARGRLEASSTSGVAFSPDPVLSTGSLAIHLYPDSYFT
jgi:hypothetical protein